MLSRVLPMLARRVASGSTSIMPLSECLTAERRPKLLPCLRGVGRGLGGLRLEPAPPPAGAAGVAGSSSLSTPGGLAGDFAGVVGALWWKLPPRSRASSKRRDSRSAASRSSSLSLWVSSASCTSSYCTCFWCRNDRRERISCANCEYVCSGSVAFCSHSLSISVVAR